jgi:hypothetical protein
VAGDQGMATIDRRIAPDKVERLVLSSFFIGYRYMEPFLSRLGEQHIYTVEDILPYNQTTLFRKVKTSERNARIMVSDLKKIGVLL